MNFPSTLKVVSLPCFAKPHSTGKLGKVLEAELYSLFGIVFAVPDVVLTVTKLKTAEAK